MNKYVRVELRPLHRNNSSCFPRFWPWCSPGCSFFRRKCHCVNRWLNELWLWLDYDRISESSSSLIMSNYETTKNIPSIYSQSFSKSSEERPNLISHFLLKGENHIYIVLRKRTIFFTASTSMYQRNNKFDYFVFNTINFIVFPFLPFSLQFFGD